jgi:hypothetical protein
MAVASWILALSTDPEAVVDGDSLLTIGVSLGLAIGAVLLMPIDRLWVRLLVNPVVLSVPILAVLDLFFG